MAAIEKVCEFSNEYPGWKMYGYKRNHIQIIPTYRKLFHGAEAHLEIVKVGNRLVFKGGDHCNYNPKDDWDINLSKLKGTRILPEYTYVLVVKDENLKGQVNGNYFNYTFDLKDTVKRLKRMLRCRNLKVKYNIKESV